MNWGRFFKAAWRSRSVSFARARTRLDHADRRTLTWNHARITYRPCTDDPANIEKILLKSPAHREYWLPKAIDPRIILDCGANIGLTTLHFHQLWPEARIIALEPFAESYALLQQNVRGRSLIKPLQLAGGQSDGFAELWAVDPRRTGSMSLRREQNGPQARVMGRVEVVRLDTLLKSEGLHGFDVIKLDTEGSEAAILASLPEESLQKTKWVVGELHGVRDWEVIRRLHDAGFAIDIRKRLHKTHFKFNACHRSILPKILEHHGPELKRLQS